MGMYSKERGFSRPPAGSGGADRPVRTPRVSVPPNYSGHAIVDGVERPLGVMREDPPASEDRPDMPTPRFDGLPRVSELGGESRRAPRLLTAAFDVTEEDVPSREAQVAPSEDRRDGAPSSLSQTAEASASAESRPVSKGSERPSEAGALRFLSGGGIGLEELLILGLILFLLRENSECAERGDLDETVILLGLLLLLG